jgi:hypothetical protein
MAAFHHSTPGPRDAHNLCSQDVMDGIKNKSRSVSSVEPDGCVVTWKKMRDGSVVSDPLASTWAGLNTSRAPLAPLHTHGRCLSGAPCPRDPAWSESLST